MKSALCRFLGVGVSSAPAPAVLAVAPAARPNIVFILSDDVGQGDLGCDGAHKIKTPHLDRLVREGLRFTDAHSTASVCTPTRFAFMTGRQGWRQRGTGNAAGNATQLIVPGTPTVASLLQGPGYRTGFVGKWPPGLGATEVDFNAAITPGPREQGFGHAFVIPATGDRVPCVFVENDRVVGLDPADPIRVSEGKPVGNGPTGLTHPERLIIEADRRHSQAIVNGVSRTGYMTGGSAALWKDADIADTLTRRAVAFLANQKACQPFFLSLAPPDLHEPMVPHPRFRGTSVCGWRGDVIQPLDWTAGEVLGALDRRGLARNMPVIFPFRQRRCDHAHRRRRNEPSAHRPAAQRRSARFQEFALPRWPSRSVSRPLAGAHSGGRNVRRADRPGRSAPHVCDGWGASRFRPVAGPTRSAFRPRSSAGKARRAGTTSCCRTTASSRSPCGSVRGNSCKNPPVRPRFTTSRPIRVKRKTSLPRHPTA